MYVMNICLVHAFNHRKELNPREVVSQTFLQELQYKNHQNTELYLKRQRNSDVACAEYNNADKNEEQPPSGSGETDMNQS